MERLDLSHGVVVRVIGYLRVSTVDQAERGVSLDAQRTAIEREVTRRGWLLVDVVEDAGASGGSLRGRPSLAGALTRLDAGHAAVLMVAKLDRLSRSVSDFATLLDRARRRQWGLIALDLGVDTTTPAGELVANVMAAVAQWERRVIGQRTKEGLAVRRAAGQRLGRPHQVRDEVILEIVAARGNGASFRSIANTLNGKGVSTAQGGSMWHASTVAAIMKGQRAAELMAPVEPRTPR